MKNLCLSLYALWDFGDKRHAQTVMKDLGISYLFSIPQSIADVWWFWGCSSVPDPLPPYLSEMRHVTTEEALGWGVKPEDAEVIGGIP